MEDFATAHETGVEPGDLVPLEYNMDMKNNKKGRNYYSSNSSHVSNAISNNNYDDLYIEVRNDCIRSGDGYRFAGSNFNGSYLVDSYRLGER